MDQFLAEVLGKERRGNHGPRTGHHVASVRRTNSPASPELATTRSRISPEPAREPAVRAPPVLDGGMICTVENSVMTAPHFNYPLIEVYLNLAECQLINSYSVNTYKIFLTFYV